MILLRENVKSLLLGVGLFLVSFITFSKQQFSIPHIKEEITLDGELTEAVWQQAKLVNLDIVNHPYNNTESPVKTEVFIFEDGEKINFAFKAYDPNPEDIQGFLRDRDQAWADDLVGIKLDTFNDHRLAYKFFVNPFGVQNDGIQNEMTGDDNDLWDGIWYSYGKITDFGFVVEFSIPYRELNFQQGDDIKTWGIEMLRLYPRNQRLRISHIKIDRDNPCWICQMDELQGFEQAKTGKNLTITPSLVAMHDREKSGYLDSEDTFNESDWASENDVELGLNVRWGITPDTLLNATINPDFSTVESDAGQLRVNKNYALFFNEKRPFFLDNSEYFSSQYNLVYTRNIADPDYGAKLTGREGDHSFGFFTTRDQQTNLIISDNIGSNLATLNEESFSSALRYRYDASRDLSLGVISTIRNSDNYFNVLTGVDGKYKVTDSNQITAQFMYSNSEYEEAALEQLCFTPQDSEIYCIKSSLLDKNNGEFSDTAYKLRYDHNSADWKAHINYENLGKDFRADLGYMPEIDIKKFTTGIERIVYGDDTWWTDLFFGTNYQIKHSQDNELIAKTNALIFGIFGPMQSYFQFEYFWEDKVGDRINEQSQDISGNTTLFSLNNISLYGQAQPLSVLTVDLYMQFGDSIDYINNRVGDGVLIVPSFTWNMTKQAELNFAYNYSALDVDGDWLYKENVTDLRLGYQFNINSALKLNLVYTDSDFNESNYLVPIGMSETDDLSAQLIYSYTINPQTLFFLGFSAGKYDMFSQDIQRNRLMKMYQQEQQTAFLKLSYAWM